VTIQDPSRLADGLRVTVRDDELEADSVVSYSADEGVRVAKIDWDAIRHVTSGSA
jgi:hypothetical protein